MEDGGHASGGSRILISLILMAFFGAVGYAIGKPKGKGVLGLILGSILGVLGWIILAFIPGETVIRVKPKKLCRDCRKQIPKRASSCPYCGGGGGGGGSGGKSTSIRTGTKVGAARAPGRSTGLRRRV
jgi:hypothetical protein